MKITFVCPPLSLSGGIRVVAIYAKYLREFGHEVLVVSPPHPAPGRLTRVLRKLGLPQWPDRAAHPSHLDGEGVAQKTLSMHRAVRARDVPDADVIIATWWETAEQIEALPAAKGRKVYFVQHLELFDWMPHDRVVATYASSMQKIVIAQWLVKAIESEGNRVGCTVVPNAVDRTQFFAAPRARNARPRIGTLFSDTPFKGFDVTLKVLEKVRQSMPDVDVVAFGSHAPVTYRDRMHGIELTVAPPQDRIREIYASCDVWLSCSVSEGFNLTAMEAMACRTPVVSTRTGWPEEAIVAGVNGALAPVNDAAALADAVLEILRLPPADWAGLSEGAVRTVSDSSWERSARLFEAALIRNQTQTPR